MLGDGTPQRRRIEAVDELVLQELADGVFRRHLADHPVVEPLGRPAGDGDVRERLLDGGGLVVPRDDRLHLAFQELERDLVFGHLHGVVVRTVRLDEEIDRPLVVVVGAARPPEHLFELLDGEPLDAHRERVEDHL